MITALAVRTGISPNELERCDEQTLVTMCEMLKDKDG